MGRFGWLHASDGYRNNARTSCLRQQNNSRNSTPVHSNADDLVVSTAQSARRSRRAERGILLLILLFALLSAAIYLFAFTKPFLLSRYVAQPLLDLGKIGGYEREAGWRFIIPLLILWVLYLLAILLAPLIHNQRSLIALAFGGASVFGVILLWLYPITAADIFNYVIYGLVQHRGENPFIVPPNTVIHWPLIQYSAWPEHPTPYGPVWQWIAWSVTAITGERLLAGLLLFKGVLLAMHLLNTALLARLALLTGHTQPGVAALLYAWNPFILYEAIGNGHNDLLLLTGLLCALLVMTHPIADTLTLPIGALAALTKYSGILWLAPLTLAWLPRVWRERRPLALVLATAGVVTVVFVAYTPFWDHGNALTGVRRQADLHTTSLVNQAMTFNEQHGIPVAPNQLLDGLKQLVLLLLVLIALLTRPRDDSVSETARAAFDLSLAYLLLGAIWFQPWYLIPLIGLIPLVNATRRFLACGYALSATGTYYVFFYLWPALNWTPDFALIQRWAVSIAHGPIWLTLFFLGLWRLRRWIITQRASQQQTA